MLFLIWISGLETEEKEQKDLWRKALVDAMKFIMVNNKTDSQFTA
jgi:hypothetical protein